MNEYLEQAKSFLEETKSSCDIEYIGLDCNQNWNEDDTLRCKYRVTLTSPRGEYKFFFWDSIHNTELHEMTRDEMAMKMYGCPYDDNGLSVSQVIDCRKKLKKQKEEATPNEYDILACMQAYDPGTFKDFCGDFGYGEDSIRALRTYLAVQEEYRSLTRLYTAEQMEKLAEIA